MFDAHAAATMHLVFDSLTTHKREAVFHPPSQVANRELQEANAKMEQHIEELENDRAALRGELNVVAVELAEMVR